jgi:hypothetical protein
VARGTAVAERDSGSGGGVSMADLAYLSVRGSCESGEVVRSYMLARTRRSSWPSKRVDHATLASLAHATWASCTSSLLRF